MVQEFNTIDFSNLHINKTSKRLYTILQKWLPFANKEFTLWDKRENCGHFFGGSYFYGVETAYPMFIFALLAKYGEYDESITGVKREELEDKAIKSMRYLCFTHDIGPKDCVREKSDNVYANGTKWGGENDEFFRATSVGRTGTFLAITALLLHDKVDDEIMKMIEKIVTNFANRWSEELPRTGTYFDTQSEENAWTALGIVGALVLYKKHPNRDKWLEAFSMWCMNSISTSKDRMNTDLFNGKSLRNHWMKGVTFHPDFTTENHSFLHPGYVASGILLKFEAATFLKMTGNELPEAILYNNEKVYDHALKTWFQDDGLLVPIQGQDWWYNRYHGVHYLHTIMSLFYNKEQSTYYEKESITYIEKLQDSHKAGTLLEDVKNQKIDEHGHYSLKMMEHGNAIIIAFSFLLHTYFGDKSTNLSIEDINSNQKGVFEFPFGGSIVHRKVDSFSCFSFRNKVMAFTLPKEGMWVITPIISSLTGEIQFEDRKMPKSLSNEGDIRDTVKKDIYRKENGFCSTCKILRDDKKIIQDISFVSLPNGITIYIEEFAINKYCKIQKFQTGVIGIRNENIKMLPSVAKGYVTLFTHEKSYQFKGYWGGSSDDIVEIKHNGYLNIDHKIGYLIYGGNKVTYVNKHVYTSWKGVEDQLICNHVEASVLKKGSKLQPLILISIPNSDFKSTKNYYEKSIKYHTNVKHSYVLEIDDYLIYSNFSEIEQKIRATSTHLEKINIFTGETFITHKKVIRIISALPFHSEYIEALGQITLDSDIQLRIFAINNTIIIENISNSHALFTFNETTYEINPLSFIKIVSNE